MYVYIYIYIYIYKRQSVGVVHGRHASFVRRVALDKQSHPSGAASWPSCGRFSYRDPTDQAPWSLNSKNAALRDYTANLRTNIVDSRGFDWRIILILRDGIPRPKGDFPEVLSQAILVGLMLVGRLGVRCNTVLLSTSTITERTRVLYICIYIYICMYIHIYIYIYIYREREI